MSKTSGIDFSGRRILVTGAGRGIGKAFIDGLLARGAARVYASAREIAAIDKTDSRVVPVKLDVTRPADIIAARAICGDIDTLINNAGLSCNTHLLQTDQPDAARMEIETNYLGTLNMCRAFVPVIEGNTSPDRPGVLINMASILARVNLPMMGSHCAAKAAVYSLSSGLRAELADRHVRVFAVLPGAVDTEMTRDFPPPKAAPADIVQEILDEVSAGTPEIYPGDMAKGLAEGLIEDRDAVLAEVAGYV